MAEVTSRLTVLFEEPFWIGVYERQSEKGYEVCKLTFGAEPKDYEVYAFLLQNRRSFCFSPAIEGEMAGQRRINPKRMQREIRAQLQERGIGTKAQQALKLQQEQGKLARRVRSRERREEEQAAQFALRQQKKKEKHRGH